MVEKLTFRVQMTLLGPVKQLTVVYGACMSTRDPTPHSIKHMSKRNQTLANLLTSTELN